MEGKIMRAETRDGKGEAARSRLKRRENGEQKKYETDRQVNEIVRWQGYAR